MIDRRDTAAYKQLEETLLQEIAEIADQIRELSHQKQSLEQLLAKARLQSDFVKRSDVTRKNSMNRVLVEGAVMQSIKRANKPVKAKSLFGEARLMVSSLRENTFRSYLFRMKARGLIVPLGSGMWQVGPKAESPSLNERTSDPAQRNPGAA
jgi:cell division septum initiation protein DivIVA